MAEATHGAAEGCGDGVRTLAFLTGTRADFGKLSSLVAIARDTPGFRARILATGMHLEDRYGKTVHEIEKAGFGDLLDTVRNHAGEGRMDEVLARTVAGVGAWLARERPDLLVVHGDRVEAMAGTLAASLQGVRVAHVEGGELSGTIDEHLRHAITKLSHLHLVSNDAARARLLQLGEHPDTVHVIGSPEVDAMTRPDRPGLAEALAHYGIPFRDFGIVAFHPVTTELDTLRAQAEAVFGAALDSGENLVVVCPNSDAGSEDILAALAPLRAHARVRVFPSIRFQYMLALLENARFVLGNSSMGVREAPFFGTPALDVGTRQQGRSHNPHVRHLPAERGAVRAAIARAAGARVPPTSEFGSGQADLRFRALLEAGVPWSLPVQKRFVDAPPVSAPPPPTALAPAPLPAPDTLRIEGLRLPARVGAYAWEESCVQALVFDLAFEVDVPRAAGSDALGDTLDYAGVARCVEEVLGVGHIRLVETVAERVASAILTRFPVVRAEVRVRKPDVPVTGASAVVTVTRVRSSRPA